MNKKVKKIFIFLFCFFSFMLQSQTTDTLFNKSLDEVKKSFLIFNKEKKRLFSNAYLLKAKQKNNAVKIANGYYLKSLLHSHFKQSITYVDSVIEIAERIQDKSLLGKGYLQKGIQHYYQAEHEEAFNNYIIANNYFTSSENKLASLRVRHCIGLLKNENNEELEALNIFRENIKFFTNENITKYNRQYLLSLFALTDSYNRNDIRDSALIASRIGLKESRVSKSNLYPFFVISYGITKRDMGQYKTGIDSILKGTTLIKELKKEVSNAYLLIAEGYYNARNEEKYVEYLEKIDSMYQIHPQVIFHARDSYEKLLIFHRKHNNKNKQLVIIDKLLAVDSIVDEKNELLSKKIAKNYDIPLLIKEKESLIQKLQLNSTNNKKISFTLLTLLILYVIYLIRKNITYKTRFNLILQNQKNSVEGQKNKKIKTHSISGISKEIVDDILIKLNHFEKSKKFIKNGCTLNSISKELGTNSAYLSKIINIERGTNFSTYLNNLRIDFAIERLTNDKKFRLYTISAIAIESGFNNAQSFSNAFYKKNKLYPSYFIKQLKK